MNKALPIILIFLSVFTFMATSCSDVEGESPCDGVTCSGHGACQATGDTAHCICTQGYYADGLECLVVSCDTTTCIHGTCFGDECKCNTGYAGINCDTCADGYHAEGLTCVPNDPCDETNPCNPNGGTCILQNEQPVCQCDPGYTGDTCYDCDTGYHESSARCVADSPCNPDPCVHGGCSEVNGNASCDCETGYTGDICDACDDGYHVEGLSCVADSADGDQEPDGDDIDEDTTEETPTDGDVTDDDTAEEEPADGDITDDADPEPETDGDVEDDATDTANACDPNPCTEQWKTQCSDVNGIARCDCDAGYQDKSGVCEPECSGSAAMCTFAHESATHLVSANGFGALLYNKADKKFDTLFEHPYRNWDANIWTRDMMHDSYFGLKTDTANGWLNTVAPDYAGYYRQTGIIHLVRHVGTLRIDTYAYAPWELSRPAMVMIAKVTNEGTSPAGASLYTLHNYRLGDTSTEEPVYPQANGERIQYDATSGSYFETGPGGAMVYWPLGGASHHGCSPENPWSALSNGQNLADNNDSGTGDDKVAGFQKDFTLTAGQSGWFGVVSGFDRYSNYNFMLNKFATVYGSQDAMQALQAAADEWETWRTAPPAGLNDAELFAYRSSESVLRMGQVWEDEYLGKGQILASLPPGQWNITWIRDMSYALLGLIRSGHYDEAKAGFEFLLGAESGLYTDYVGMPYQISITRYFGRGKEETDFNDNGPNIEFDGFGLFLWALGEYVQASGDTALVTGNWDIINGKVAAVLEALVSDTNGLIDADSSIWEVHWNGQQKQFSYTSLAASHGLCHFSKLAQQTGHGTEATTYGNLAVSLATAIRTHLLDGNSVLASSVEELAAGPGHYMDLASSEAFAWMVLDPTGTTASASFSAWETNLTVASGYGFYRNDNGDAYDQQEWVFCDLRMADAYRNAGRSGDATALTDWVTAQTLKNHGLIAELYDKVNGNYAGSVPMVGFGAGLYINAMWNRATPPAVTPLCGSWE